MFLPFSHSAIKLKTFLTENLSSLSSEFMTLIVEKVTVIKTIKNENSFISKKEELRALKIYVFKSKSRY